MTIWRHSSKITFTICASTLKTISKSRKFFNPLTFAEKMTNWLSTFISFKIAKQSRAKSVKQSFASKLKIKDILLSSKAINKNTPGYAGSIFETFSGICDNHEKEHQRHLGNSASALA